MDHRLEITELEALNEALPKSCQLPTALKRLDSVTVYRKVSLSTARSSEHRLPLALL